LYNKTADDRTGDVVNSPGRGALCVLGASVVNIKDLNVTRDQGIASDIELRQQLTTEAQRTQRNR
jgi:hypothetical protein